MARMLSIFAVFAAALALASGTRLPLQAATTPSADLVFLIEASQASFTNATTLALNGLTATAQSYGAGAKTGIYPIQNFTDASANSQYVDSNGQWLSNPQAVMYGVTQDGNVTTVLLTLSNPTPAPQQAASTTTNNNNNNNAGSTITNNNNGPPELTFTVALVPTDASKVKYQNGVVAAKVAEAANGVGNLAQAITAGATFGPVVIYIDQNQQGLSKKATTKWGGGGWGGGGWGGGWNNGWGNNGYNNGYGYGGSSNNNNNNNNNGGWGGNNNNNNNNNNGGYGGNNNNNNNNNNGGGWGSSNNNNNNNNNGGYGSSNNNNNNNNGRK